jgi:Type VI secretion system/phage-baseplate injector OB domain
VTGMDPHAERTLQEIAEERRTRFYGKYRGVVIEALTGGDLGKLKVSVPDVLADLQAVAWPCVPFAGPSHGFVAIPEAGDGVWIEFEGGNPAQAIWVGCWWGSGDMPSPSGPTVRSWVTTNGLAIVLDDDQKQISLQHPDGPSVTLSSDGITLSTDSATITLNSRGISLQGITQVSE